MADLHDLTALEQGRAVRSGEVSPVDLVDHYLDRIGRLSDSVGAFVTVTGDLARRQAVLAADGVGDTSSPLYGVPTAVKDLNATAGVVTQFGSATMAGYVPEVSDEVVLRLERAGTISLGKTNTPEFAAGGNTFNEVFGRTRNPWDLTKSAGGSTGGGCAALATGMIALGEGTDLGGSLRIPASFCGVVGIRPSVGLVPTYPSDWVWDHLQVTGPVARTAEDLGLMLQAVAGPSPLAPIAQPTAGRTFFPLSRAVAPGSAVAYCPDIAGIGIDPAIERVCREAAFALRDAGIAVEEIGLDLAFGRPTYLALRGLWFVAQMYPRLDKMDRLGVNVSNNVKGGLKFTTQELAAAEAARGRLWHMFRELFERFHYLLTPCMAVPPFPVEQNYPETVAGKKMETYVDWLAPTFVLSLTGLPVASVPCGLDGGGLPVGLQIVGPQLGEEAVLALAAEVQRLRPIGKPPLSALK